MSQKVPHGHETRSVLVASLLVVFVLPASFQSSRSKAASSFSRLVNRVVKEGFEISFLLKKNDQASYELRVPRHLNKKTR